jgi:hypothetical protein
MERLVVVALVGNISRKSHIHDALTHYCHDTIQFHTKLQTNKQIYIYILIG